MNYNYNFVSLGTIIWNINYVYIKCKYSVMTYK